MFFRFYKNWAQIHWKGKDVAEKADVISIIMFDRTANNRTLQVFKSTRRIPKNHNTLKHVLFALTISP